MHSQGSKSKIGENIFGKPYSDNIIFVDTEFTSLDLETAELMSVGMVKMDGESLYLEIEHDRNKESEWVKKNIVPRLKGFAVGPKTASEKMDIFVGKTRAYLMSFVNCLDVMHLRRLYGHIDGWPFHWIPMDFASFLFSLGVDPEEFIDPKSEFRKSLKLKNLHTHNALEDAKSLREAYLKITGGNYFL